VSLTQIYVTAYERITGLTFTGTPGDVRASKRT
jgi:hypothetical protein